MRIAILNDTHAGIKNGSDVFLNYMDRFYSEVFFPYCIENDIKHIIHLGDYFDHRKQIGIKVLNRNKEMFLDKLIEHDIVMDIIPGNHDVAFKNTNSLCSLIECLSHYKNNVNIFMNPAIKDYDGLSIGLLPWITADNYADSIEFIKTCKASIIGCHLELEGFQMMKGAPLTSHGMSPTLFERYETVLSGHFHTKSSNKNIHYLGSQYEMTWADADDPKYFHILDTATRELKAIRNPLCIFNKIVYDDSNDSIENLDLSYTNGSFVKIVVTSKSNPIAFDKFIDKLQTANPFEYKIVESFAEYAATAVFDDEVSLEDTSSLLNSYVESVETDLNKDRIKRILNELYIEAQASDAL
jgi:hypothetical protein